MIRKHFLWILPLVVVIVSSLAIWTVWHEREKQLQEEGIDRELELYRAVRRNIVQNYVGNVDVEELLIGALSGMTDPLDQHSSFLGQENLEAFRKSSDGLIPGGIGVRIRQADEGVLVITPLWNTPAMRAGILPDDLIIKIDGEAVVDMTSSDVSSRLGGEPGTVVSLSLLRGDEHDELEVVIERAVIELASVAQLGFVDETRQIGYLRLSSFQEDSGREVAAAYDRLLAGGMQALIFDLRSNLGGRLSAAREIADLFLDEGTIVITQGRRQEDFHVATASAEGTLEDRPMVVLVDDDSASASEVLAGALQDHQRALIVGTRTWGKGSVQEIFIVDDQRLALKLTTKRYLTPLGRSLHREPNSGTWGIAPDIVIGLDEEERLALAQGWDDSEILHEASKMRPLVPPFKDRQLSCARDILNGTPVASDPHVFR